MYSGIELSVFTNIKGPVTEFKKPRKSAHDSHQIFKISPTMNHLGSIQKFYHDSIMHKVCCNNDIPAG